MSIPWESPEAGTVLTALSWFLLQLTLPLHSVLSLWGFTRKLLAIYLSQHFGGLHGDPEKTPDDFQASDGRQV